MIETRATVESIEKARKSIEALGAEFKNHYILKDIIFIPEGKENLNLSDEFLRVRTNVKSEWKTKKTIIVIKQTAFHEFGKTDKLILREEFDSEEEALKYVKEKLPNFKKSFEFQRDGWQYQLKHHRIFIEDIEGWKPSIEIEADNKEELRELLDKIGYVEIVKDSVPEIMRNNSP